MISKRKYTRREVVEGMAEYLDDWRADAVRGGGLWYAAFVGREDELVNQGMEGEGQRGPRPGAALGYLCRDKVDAVFGAGELDRLHRELPESWDVSPEEWRLRDV